MDAIDQPLISLVIVVGLAFLLAGFVKGVIGLGLPTVAIGVLGLVMAPAQAMALLVVPSLVTNLWQGAVGSGLRDLLFRLWPMLLGICAGTAGGAALGIHADAHAATLLGLALVAYALFGLSTKRFTVTERTESWLAPLIGVSTGLVTVATGVFVLPAVPYLQALDLDKDHLVQALGISFSVSTLAMALALFGNGSFPLQTAGYSLAALAPAAVGMLIGQWLRLRVRAQTFRLCFFAGLLLLGTHLALKSFL